MFCDQGKKGLLILVCFVCLAFISCSCAKKQVKPPEGAISTTEESAGQKMVSPSGGEGTPGVKMEELETAEAKKRAEEAERKAEEAKRLEEEIEEFETTKIHFDFDKADLRPEAREILKKKAEWLLDHKEYDLKIEGYCDERGTEEYNLALGQRRAESAKKYLIELGVSPDRIYTISYGEENPIDPRHCEEAWAKNRRDEFKLIKR